MFGPPDERERPIGVELVDEDDRRRRLLGLREQVTHARGADADDHLDELRRRHLEERHARLAGDRARQQRLAGPGRAAEQHAARDPRRPASGTCPGFLRKSTISVSSSLASSMPGDVLEGDVLLVGLDPPRPRAPERHQAAGAATAAGRAAHEQERDRMNNRTSARSRRSALEERRRRCSGSWRSGSTPCCLEECSSSWLSANDGIWVAKFVGRPPRSRLVLERVLERAL